MRASQRAAEADHRCGCSFVRLISFVIMGVLLGGCQAPADKSLQRPQAVAATRFAQHDMDVGGMRLRFIDESPQQRAPVGTVLLVHGHTSRIEEYEGLVAPLAEHLRVLVVDLPGSGYSDKPEREYSLTFYEDVLIAFLDTLGVGRLYVAGGSMGGNLTLRLGHRFPERFERLAPWAPGSTWEAQPTLAWLTRLGAGYPLFWPTVKIQSRFWYSDDWPLRDATLAATFNYYEEIMGPGFVRMYFDMAADQVGWSLFEIAAEIEQPTWLGWGDRDHGANMGDGVARLHELLPNSELRVFPGARHSLAAEIPEELAAALVGFLVGPGIEEQ